MNTYRKAHTNNVTFTQNGVIDTPRSRVSNLDKGTSWKVDALVMVSLIALVVRFQNELTALVSRLF